MRYPTEIATTLKELARLEYLATDLNLLPRQPVNSILSGKHASKLRGRGLDFSEVRKYVVGDDIRNIDWKVTARTKVTHTKVFNEEKEKPAFVIVDQSSSMFFASQGTVKSVLAAQLAAIAGYKILKAGDRIGGLVFDDDHYETINPKRSRKALLRLLEVVVRKNQDLVDRKRVARSKTEIINQVLFKTRNVVTHDYLVLVISDFQTLDENGRQYLTQIAQHNDVIAMVVGDPLEFDMPADKMTIGDGEQQVMWSGDEKVRERFREFARTRRKENLEYLGKYGVPVLRFNTLDPLLVQIKNLFGRR